MHETRGRCILHFSWFVEDTNPFVEAIMSLSPLMLIGTAYEIGEQHGRQIAPVRPLLAEGIAARLDKLRQIDADCPAHLRPAVEALEALDRPLCDFLAGLAAALELDAGDLMRYTLSSYLLDLAKVTATPVDAVTPLSTIPEWVETIETLPSPQFPLMDGCTTWAAAGRATAGGSPLLVKNRDYHQNHVALQRLAHVIPAQGYAYASLGSAGSPNVFSSGINERGLAVADTHVLSRDIGPGLPRFSLMREILEQHATTASALDYLRSVPHMGAGTLSLADATDHLAVCESGHRHSEYRECISAEREDVSFLVSTNHFIGPNLIDQWVEDEPTTLLGNSLARHERTASALRNAGGGVDIAWAQALMSSHGTPQNALCRHPLQANGEHAYISTISTIIFAPCGLPGRQEAGPALLLANGLPCQAQWHYSFPFHHRRNSHARRDPAEG
jgi:isopenicillin-N N-acyltransferase like protein